MKTSRSLSRQFAAVVTLALGGLSGCAPPAEEPAEQPAEVATAAELEAEQVERIRSLVGEYVQAYNDSNAEALVELFTPTAVQMPPDEPAHVGHTRIRNSFITLFETYEPDVQINVEETRFSGEIAIVRGTWAVTLTSKATGDARTTVGKWLNVIDEQEDGSWLISRNIFNRDQPLPPQ